MSTLEDAVSERIRGLLAELGHPWPAPIEHHAALGSTNDRLKEQARGGALEWTSVVTDTQTAGHGREARGWVSPPGNLYLSVLLRPPAPIAGLLPLAAGLAVAEAAEKLGTETRVKWPNDILAGGRKLAGILAESVSAGSVLDWVVIGIGLNLDPRGPLPPAATSLRAEGGRADREEAAASVLARLAVWYDALKRERPGEIVAEWRRRSLPWWGRPVEARSGDDVVQGVAVAVDERGALVLELPDGTRRAVVSGEVHEVRLAGGGLS